MNELITDFIAQGKFFDARNEIVKMNVVDIAQLLEELDEDSVLMVFRLLPKDIAVEVFTYMSYEQQQFIIESITDKEIKILLMNFFLMIQSSFGRNAGKYCEKGIKKYQ